MFTPLIYTVLKYPVVYFPYFAWKSRENVQALEENGTLLLTLLVFGQARVGEHPDLVLWDSLLVTPWIGAVL